MSRERTPANFALCSALCVGLASTHPATAVEITHLAEPSVACNEYVEVHGTGFGDSPGEMLIDGMSAPVAAWSDTEVVGYVPDGTLPGTTQVQVSDGLGNADTIGIEIVFGPGPQGQQLYFSANQNSYAIALDDGDVDLRDHVVFSGCVTSPGGGVPGGCEVADLDGDGDTDLKDFAALQAAFGG